MVSSDAEDADANRSVCGNVYARRYGFRDRVGRITRSGFMTVRGMSGNTRMLLRPMRRQQPLQGHQPYAEDRQGELPDLSSDLRGDDIDERKRIAKEVKVEENSRPAILIDEEASCI